jgi:hypothetical protein
MAVNGCVVPCAIEALLGLIWMDCRVTCPLPPPLVGGGEVEAEVEVPPPQLARINKSAITSTTHNLRIGLPRQIGEANYTLACHFLDES